MTEDSATAILEATRQLLALMIRVNRIDPIDVASVIFTTTRDLTAEYPALAARQLGWLDTPLLCGHEMDVPHGLPRCVRILIHWNTDLSPAQIHHVYLGEAISLRPDQAELPPIDQTGLQAWIEEQLVEWNRRETRDPLENHPPV